MTTDYSSNWDKFSRRIEQLAQHRMRHQKDALTRIQVVLYVAADGTLKGWEEPYCQRMEPSNINWCDELRG